MQLTAAGARGLVLTSARPLLAQDFEDIELVSAVVTTLVRCLAGHCAAVAHGTSSRATTTTIQYYYNNYYYNNNNNNNYNNNNYYYYYCYVPRPLMEG